MKDSSGFRCVFIVHYFPPINSSGAKRFEFISKYLARDGVDVTVITTCKSGSDGEFTEKFPEGVNVIELDWFGRARSSEDKKKSFIPMYSSKPSIKRRFKDAVMSLLGQVPDPRLPFAFSFLKPNLDKNVDAAIRSADIVVGTTPPWPMILAAVICKYRFGVPCILDYRDHFSENYEMPSGRLANLFEKKLDRWLASKADYLVTISEPMAKYYKKFSDKVEVIMNGYDADVLEHARAYSVIKASEKTIIRYMGTVSPKSVPYNLMHALQKLKIENPDKFNKIRIEYYGNASILEAVIKNDFSDLADVFCFFETVGYFESLKLMIEADYLLFSETSEKSTLSSQGVLTTKLFEYIGSGRPILADISVETLAGSLLLSTNGNHVITISEKEFYNHLSEREFYVRKPDNISSVSKSLTRGAQASHYLTLMKDVASKKDKNK